MVDKNNDKTVFKQPRPGGDRTVMRPQAGRSAPSQPSASGMPPRQNFTRPFVHDAQADGFYLSSGLNPLVRCASTLLAVFEKTRRSISHPNVGELHQRLVNEIKVFDEKMQEEGLPKETIVSARYLICSVLDEAVLNTPWGSESPWGQRTLLSVFHNETSGGEKCFLILDRMRERPAENQSFIEFFYLCLSLGFEGKYRLMSRGRDSLDKIRDDLFQIIRNYRGEYERSLSPNWEGLGRVRSTLAEYVPLWVILTCVLALLFFSYTGFRYWLYDLAVPVTHELNEIHQSNDTSRDNRREPLR